MVILTVNIILTIISTLGLLLNAYILFIIILTKQTTTANNLLVLHLGAVGVLLCATTLGSWIPGAPCALSGFLNSLLHPVALWTVCGLNCDRYYAISAPLHYGALVNPKKVLCGLAGIWLAALLLSAPPLLGAAPYKPWHPLGSCAPDWTAPEALWYCIIYTVLTLLLPALLVLVCNLKILMIARYHRHRIASAIYEVTLSAQVTITHQRNPFFVPTVTSPNAPKVRNRSAISTVLQFVGSFFLLYFPYYVVIMWQSMASIVQAEFKVVPIKVPPQVITLAASFLTCSPPINGLLYGIKSKVLRKTFQNYWRKKMMKNEINQEIQARTPSTCGSQRPSITPLSMMNKPCLQRRLSEALLDVGKPSSPHKNNKMKRIASESAWKSGMTFTGLDSPNITKENKTIAHTSSCNTLRVPNSETDNNLAQLKEDESYISFKSSFKTQEHTNPRASAPVSPRPAMSTANLILQRVFGLEAQEPSQPNPTKRPRPRPVGYKRSPRILITRAFSEESDKSPSLPDSPSRDAMSRKYSSSTTTLLERKWKILRQQDDSRMETDSDSEFLPKRQGLNGKMSSETVARGNSDSSSGSEEEGRKYASLDERLNSPTKMEEVEPEEQLLLSWPTTRRKQFHLKVNGILQHSNNNKQNNYFKNNNDKPHDHHEIFTG